MASDKIRVGKPGLRILYLGMAGEFSDIPLRALLAAGYPVCAVVAPAPRTGDNASSITPVEPSQPGNGLRVVNSHVSRNIVQTGWQHGIPVYQVAHLRAAETVETFAALAPDIGCVACFSQRIPGEVLALPRHGFLNIHPALLPAYRGPAPLFWALRNGETETGVTVHYMDEGLDSGDIAAQVPVPLPDGISGAEAERLCAARGAELLIEVLQKLVAGRLSPWQQPEGGSYHPRPCAEDFALDPGWSARRAFNFMRGAVEWGQPYRLSVPGTNLILARALSYDDGGQLEAPFVRQGDRVHIQFLPGVLEAELFCLQMPGISETPEV